MAKACRRRKKDNITTRVSKKGRDRETVSMNFEFIEGRQTGDKVVKSRGVRIANKEVVYDKGEGGGVGVVAEEHGGGGLFSVPVLGEEGEKAELG